MIAEENRVEATPGPWEVCEFSADHPDALPGEVGVYAPQHPDSYIKEDGTWHGITICRGMTGPAKYANAQLIASVPDLRATIDAQAQELDRLRGELATVLNVAIARGERLDYDSDDDYKARYRELTGKGWDENE